MAELHSLYKNLSGSTSKDIVDTSSSVLESLLLLKKINEQDWSKDPELGEIANQEIKYIRAASKAVSSDLAIQQIYGKSLDSVLKVASIMKAREEERIGQKVLDDYLENPDIKEKMTTAEKSLFEMRKQNAKSVIRDSS